MRIVEIVYRYDADEERRRPEDARSARERLERGNLDFARLVERVDSGDEPLVQQVVHVDPRELGVRSGGQAPRQRPFAAVLGCADARVPIELVFHEGPNDLFVVRVAGNVLGPDILGSLRYAIEHLSDSLRLVVVLGHSGCGAIGAAVDTFLRPAGYLDLADQHDLRGIVDGLLATVLIAARVLSVVYGPGVESRAGYRAALTELSVVFNAALGAFTVRKELERLTPRRCSRRSTAPTSWTRARSGPRGRAMASATVWATRRRTSAAFASSRARPRRARASARCSVSRAAGSGSARASARRRRSRPCTRSGR